MPDKNFNRIQRNISVLYRYGQAFAANELKDEGIGSGQYIFLFSVNKNPGISQNELSEHLFLDKTTTTRALQKLEDGGFIIRKTDDKDRRILRVYITEKGKNTIPKIRQIIKKWVDVVTYNFTKEERDTFLNLLEKGIGNAKELLEK